MPGTVLPERRDQPPSSRRRINPACYGSTVHSSPAQERLNLVVLCASQFLTLAGMTAVLPLLPLYLGEVGVTGSTELRWWTGALGSAPFAIAVFATPIWGELADRVGYKPMVVRSVTGIALVTAGMGVAHSPDTLLGWRCLQGVVSGVFPAAVALLTAATPASRSGRALAHLQSWRAAGALAGPPLGGLRADVFGIRPVFFAASAVAGVTALACFAVLEEPARSPRHRAAGPASGFRDVLASREMLVLLGATIVFQMAALAWWPNLAFFVEKIGVPRDTVASTTGFIVLASGLPSTLLPPLWHRLTQRCPMRWLLVVSLAGVGVANVATGLAGQHLASVVGWRLVAGIFAAGFVPLSFQWMNTLAPEGSRGRMAGIASTAMMLGNVFGPVAGSWLAIRSGLEATFWAPGLLLLAAAVATAALLPKTPVSGEKERAGAGASPLP